MSPVRGTWMTWNHMNHSPCSTLSPTLLGHQFFAVFFSTYEAAAGIGTGYYALRNAQALPAGAQEAVHEAVIDMPGLSLIFGLSIVGSGAWVVALIAAAIALRRAGTSRGPFILLILAGVLGELNPVVSDGGPRLAAPF